MRKSSSQTTLSQTLPAQSIYPNIPFEQKLQQPSLQSNSLSQNIMEQQQQQMPQQLLSARQTLTQSQQQKPHQLQMEEEIEQEEQISHHHHSTPDHLIKEYVLDQYEELVYVNTLNASLFGEIKLFRLNPFVKYIGSKRLQYSKNVDYQQRTEIRNPHIIYSLGYIKKLQESVNIFFEYNMQPFSSLLQKRHKLQLYMPEDEILALCKGVTYALKQLQDIGVAHGNIDSRNVFFDIDYFLYRIYDNELLNGKFSGLSRLLKNQDEPTVLAPELLALLGRPLNKQLQQQIENVIEPYKCDVFSLGMLLIEAATLQSSLECYDFARRCLRPEIINQRLTFIGSHYSQHFARFLQMCIEERPEQRPDWNHVALCLMDENLFRYSNESDVNFIIKLSDSSSARESQLQQMIAPQLEIPYIKTQELELLRKLENPRQNRHNRVGSPDQQTYHSSSPKILRENNNYQPTQQTLTQKENKHSNIYKSFLFDNQNNGNIAEQNYKTQQQQFSNTKPQSKKLKTGKKMNQQLQQHQQLQISTQPEIKKNPFIYQNENYNYIQYQNSHSKDKENLNQNFYKNTTQTMKNQNCNTQSTTLLNPNNQNNNNNCATSLNNQTSNNSNYLQQKLVSLNRMITECLQQPQQFKNLY